MDARDTKRREPMVDWSEQGYELYDADGDKIGDIVEVNPDYLVVEYEKGLLEMLGLEDPSTMYVPRSAIAREDGERWFLNIEKDRLEEQRTWTERPAGSRYGDYGARGDAGDYRATDEGGPRRTRLVRHEEDLDVNKVSRQRGEATVSKRVVEENKTIDVPVRREELHVERRPVDRSRKADASTKSGEAFKEDKITVPLMEEDVEVRKTARPVEEVELSKSSHEETRRVDDTVRREEFDIDDDAARGKTTRDR
jgi:uncharacterized protein (TIGR02271 family)